MHCTGRPAHMRLRGEVARRGEHASRRTSGPERSSALNTSAPAKLEEFASIGLTGYWELLVTVVTAVEDLDRRTRLLRLRSRSLPCQSSPWS